MAHIFILKVSRTEWLLKFFYCCIYYLFIPGIIEMYSLAVKQMEFFFCFDFLFMLQADFFNF